MSSLDNTFNELLSRLKDPEALNPAKSDPVFYFAYPPEKMLELKKSFPRWTAKLRDAGFTVSRVSLADILWGLIDKSGRWDDWLGLEGAADRKEILDAIRDVLRKDDSFVNCVRQEVEAGPPNTIVFLTEAALLHPFYRTRIIESHLHDRVKVPTVIFYPGRRSGQYGLHFLDFYSLDGNYRSTILGGM
jgi:hypothetical protein